MAELKTKEEELSTGRIGQLWHFAKTAGRTQAGEERRTRKGEQR
jgi:hypothetical protein